MNLSLDTASFRDYTSRQLNYFFPDGKTVRLEDHSAAFDLAIDRLDNCFQKVAYQRYNKDGATILNHLYADQYLMYVWFLSNTIWKETQDLSLANKLYYLNKSLHAFDCMYDTKLPDIFLVFHGAGTMLGKAHYSDYFVVLQGCTVGSQKGNYPFIDKGVGLTAHSSIIGNCHIGKRTSVSSYTSVFEKNIPEDSVVFKNHDTGITQVKPGKNCYAQQFFNVDLKTL